MSRFYIYKLLTWVTLLNHAKSVCFKSVIQSGCSLFLSKIKNTSLKLPVGVTPLQLVHLHRNRRYCVIKLHTWFCLSYFLKTNIKFYCIYQYFKSINSFFNTVSVSRYSRPIINETSHVTTHATHWPVTHFSTFYQFILNMLFNHCQWLVYWCITKNTLWSYALVLNVRMGLRNDIHVLEFREIYFLIKNIIMIIIHSTTNFFVNKYYLLYRLIFKVFLCGRCIPCCIKMS